MMIIWKTSQKQYKSSKDNTVWIGSDFNLRDINWDTHTVVPTCSQTKPSQSLLDLVEDQSMTQKVDLPTKKARTLDLFLAIHPTLVNRVITLPPLTTVMDNSILLFACRYQSNCTTKTCHNGRYNYKKVDWQAKREDMKCFRLPEGNMQKEWDIPEDKLYQMIDDHVP